MDSFCWAPSQPCDHIQYCLNTPIYHIAVRPMTTDISHTEHACMHIKPKECDPVRAIIKLTDPHSCIPVYFWRFPFNFCTLLHYLFGYSSTEIKQKNNWLFPLLVWNILGIISCIKWNTHKYVTKRYIKTSLSGPKQILFFICNQKLKLMYYIISEISQLYLKFSLHLYCNQKLKLI